MILIGVHSDTSNLWSKWHTTQQQIPKCEPQYVEPLKQDTGHLTTVSPPLFAVTEATPHPLSSISVLAPFSPVYKCINLKKTAYSRFWNQVFLTPRPKILPPNQMTWLLVLKTSPPRHGNIDQTTVSAAQRLTQEITRGQG